MTVWDWLMSAVGQELQHALIGLVVAVTLYVSHRTHGRVKDVEREVRNRLDSPNGSGK